jgi:hypothetical protein
VREKKTFHGSSNSYWHLKASIIQRVLTSAVIGTGRWAGVDSAWEQKKPEARKMLENATESRQSTARFVSPLDDYQIS